LEISRLEFESYDPVVTFNKQIDKLISDGSGIAEITMAYNDKITELFLESENFQSKMKESENQIKQLKADLEKALRNVEDRDSTLQTINGKI
jgi:peptidoglycan hydrolase CwlO-like protein